MDRRKNDRRMGEIGEGITLIALLAKRWKMNG